MKVDFEQIAQQIVPHFKGGEQEVKVKFVEDEYCRVMRMVLEPGATVGFHQHDTSSEVMYFLRGHGTMRYDDGAEEIHAGDVHYCPKGHAHGFINDGDETVEYFAVVAQQ